MPKRMMWGAIAVMALAPLVMPASASAQSAYCASSIQVLLGRTTALSKLDLALIDAVRRDCRPGDTIAVDGPAWVVGLLCDFTKTIVSHQEPSNASRPTTICVMAAERGVRGGK
jgi:hypothetical protein